MDSAILDHQPRHASATDGASGYLTIDLGALARNYEKLSA